MLRSQNQKTRLRHKQVYITTAILYCNTSNNNVSVQEISRCTVKMLPNRAICLLFISLKKQKFCVVIFNIFEMQFAFHVFITT